MITLPFIRLITAGPAMVLVLFCISGYSLALGPMKEICRGAWANGLKRVASSTFRRPARLFLPPIVASLLVLLCVRLGLYTWGDQHYPGWSGVGFAEPTVPILPTSWEQLVHWFQRTTSFLHAFTFGIDKDYSYDAHL